MSNKNIIKSSTYNFTGTNRGIQEENFGGQCGEAKESYFEEMWDVGCGMSTELVAVVRDSGFIEGKWMKK